MQDKTENQQSQEEQMKAAMMDMPTAEQIAAAKLQRAAMIAHYKEDMKNLEVEAKYNELQERVEKARFQTWQWRIRFDQMMAPPPNQTGADQGMDKASPEANQAFKAAVDTVDNTDKGNVVPLTAVTSEAKTEGQE